MRQDRKMNPAYKEKWLKALRTPPDEGGVRRGVGRHSARLRKGAGVGGYRLHRVSVRKCLCR